MAQVEWSIEALQDVDRLRDYLGSSSQDFAWRFVRRLISAAESLSEFPSRGRIVPELARSDTRELIFQNYRIVYGLTDDKLLILAVVHGRVDLRRVMSRRSWDLP